MTNHAVGIGTCTQSMTHLGDASSKKSWIKRSKQPARWRTSSVQSQLREKIFLIMKNWIWWWRQNWNGATMLLIWSKNLQSVEQWQDKKGQNILTPSERLKNVFSGRRIGSSSRRDTCSFLHSHATGDRETTWEENGRRKKISLWASILFSTESEETDWRERLVQSKGQSCD